MEDGKHESERPMNQAPDEWRGKISFNRAVPDAFDVSTTRQLPIPRWFIRQHGDKLQKFVTLQTVGDRRVWPVSIGLCTSRWPHATFCRGWKLFATSNRLVKGNRLTFTLMAKSKFEVAIDRSSTWNPDSLLAAQQGPKDLTKDSVLAWKKRRNSLNRPQCSSMTGNGYEKSDRGFIGSSGKKGIVNLENDTEIVSIATDPPELSSDMDARLFEPELKLGIRNIKQDLSDSRSKATHVKHEQATVERLEERNSLLKHEMEEKLNEIFEVKQRSLVEEHQKILEILREN